MDNIDIPFFDQSNFDVFFGVDFDSTIINGKYYPMMGPPLPHVIDTLKKLTTPQKGKPRNQIIVWTMRPSNQHILIESFFKKYKIPLHSINSHKTQCQWTDSPKIFADYFIDDRNIGIKKIGNNVDWLWVQEELKKLGFI